MAHTGAAMEPGGPLQFEQLGTNLAVGMRDERPIPWPLTRWQAGLTEAGVREGLEGNLCHCTGDHNIVRAVLAANTQD